jgi:hypothetical protein
LEERSKKYEGFPTYLLTTQWIEDFNSAIPSKNEVYLSPINNFFIVNDMFENYHFEDPLDLYKNTVVFPGALFQTFTKKYWHFLHSIINDGK